jgi:hypothetical protein
VTALAATVFLAAGFFTAADADSVFTDEVAPALAEELLAGVFFLAEADLDEVATENARNTNNRIRSHEVRAAQESGQSYEQGLALARKEPVQSAGPCLDSPERRAYSLDIWTITAAASAPPPP